MAKKETAEEKQDRLKKPRFYEALSLCGDPKQAARVVGMGMQKAYRALADPDGISTLEGHLANHSEGSHYSMDHGQRVALLTQCVLLGYMPRVAFDQETGAPNADLIYESLDPTMRLKCLDMLNKMTCSYVEKKIVETVNTDSKGVTPEMRGKLDEIYGDTKRIEETDPLAF